MEALRAWAFAICSAMVICGIALQIVPKSSMEKIFSLVVSVFILCMMLSPILIRYHHKGLVIEQYYASEAEEKSERLREVVEKQTRITAERRLEKIITDKLHQMGINYRHITININTGGQSEPDDSVDIVLDESMRILHDRTVTRLKDALQMDVRLTYAEKE